MTDNVNKPNHYTFGKYECIDVIEELFGSYEYDDGDNWFPFGVEE